MMGFKKNMFGDNVGCDVCCVLFSLWDCICRVDKVFMLYLLVVVNYCLWKKLLYNIYKCVVFQEKFGVFCCVFVSGL